VPQFRRLVSGFPLQRPECGPRSGHVGFVVALQQIFSECFRFPWQFSFHRLLHTHHHLSSAAGAIGQIMAGVPSGLSLTPPKEIITQYWGVLSYARQKGTRSNETEQTGSGGNGSDLFVRCSHFESQLEHRLS
jgi:hypothetical protein